MEIAAKIEAEIISADSGQIYRGLDIGTAKPTPEEREEVRFHLIDILNPNEQFSAADFRERALEAMSEIQSRGKRVIVAGGTGLYLKTLEQGIFDGPSKDPKIRSKLEMRIKSEGIESLHDELKQVDPEAAATIPPQNRQRIIRALEVYYLTGKPISQLWKEDRRGGPAWPPGPTHRSDPTFIKFGLNLPKEELKQRINHRVDQMIHLGLVDEVKTLLEKWDKSVPALQIIGYKEITQHLSGKFSLEMAVEQIKIHTRQYAKRQKTWFQKDKGIQWFEDRKRLINALSQYLTK